MAKDTSLYVQKKIPTFEEYKQRREEGESHEHILAQTVQEREEYHQGLPFDYYSVPSRIAAQRQDGYDELRQLAQEATGAAQNAARQSVMAYDEAGKLNPWQTALNLIQDAKSFNKAAMDAKSQEQKNREAAARRSYLRPETAEEAKKQYGLDYDLEQSSFLSKLFGRPIYTPAKGVSAAEIQGLPKGSSSAETARAFRANIEGQAQNITRNLQNTVQQALSGEGQKTGNPVLDSWGETMRKNAGAAKLIADTYGIPTYALEGSRTQQNVEAFNQRYSDMSYGQKLGANIGLTAGSYGLDFVNAGLTAADALSGGRLGTGTGTASSIFKAANFMQGAGSGLTAQAYANMRESSNWLGRLVLDLEKTGVEQLMDRAFGEGSLAAMGVRVFGSGAQESEDRGESIWKQALTGGARGAIEIGTEMMSGVGGSWRGTGYGDTFLNKVDKWFASKTGSEFVGTLAKAFSGEALEEMTSDVLNPLMDRILGIGEATGRGEDRTFMQQLGDFLADVWGDGQLLYDGLLGGLAGMGGGAIEHGIYSVQAKNLAVDVATYKAAERIAGSNSMKAKFQELTGVELSEDEQEARLEIALYLTNIVDSTDSVSNAREAETNLFRMVRTGGEQEAAERAVELTKKEKTENRAQVFSSMLDRAAGTAKVGISEGERAALAKSLAEGYVSGMDGKSYVAAALAAYRLGKTGNYTLQEAMKASATTTKLSAAQFRHFWRLGAGVETADPATVDVNTEEGKAALMASLTSLGSHSVEAATVYESGQDVSRFAAGMSEAAERYAATSTDIRSQEGGVPAESLISTLSDTQIEKAQEIGAQLRAERSAAITQLDEQRTAVREKAQALRQQSEADTQTLAEIEEQIREANRLGAETVKLFEIQRDALEATVKSDHAFGDSEEYARAFDEAKANMEKAVQLQKDVQALEAKKKEIEGYKPVKRKKGTVSLAGGNIDGTAYKGVDRENLTRQQKNIVAMVEQLADFINIDYVLFDGQENMGGAYIRGGTVYLNINSGMAQEARKSLAAASLSHELTHFMQEYAPKEYQELKDYVIKAILRKSPAEFDRLMRQQRRWEPGKSYDALADELVANACQTMLTDDKAVQRMARTNMSLAQKVADVLNEITEKIRAAFDGLRFDDDREIFAPVRAVMEEIEGITERWADGIAAAVENYNAVQTVRQAEEDENTALKGGVQYQRNTDENESIRVQTQAAQEKLNRMDVVAKVTVNDVPKSVGKAVPWVVERMKHTGFKVDRQNFGIITFDENHIREALRHITNHPDEIGAVLALPRVLKRGILIESHEKHKGRVQGSFTIAAPIAVNGVRGNMSVIVHRTTKNFFHAYRVLLPTGANFTFEEGNKKAASKRTGELSEDRALIAESVDTTMDSIADASRNSKTKFQMWDDTTDDTAAERTGRELAYARLQNENAILSQTVAEMKKLSEKQGKTIEALQKKMQITRTPETRQSDARKLARSLIREYGSKADTETVTGKIKAVGDYLLQTETSKLDENELKARARAVAAEILNTASQTVDEGTETLREIGGEIRGKKISLDEDFTGELNEDYESFRKRHFGSFTLAKRESKSRESREGYQSVDQFYNDFQGEYGEAYFPNLANEGEQLLRLAEVLELSRPMEVNPFAQYMGEAMEYLANQITMDAMSGVLRQTELTTADKQKARTKALQEQIQELKAENKLSAREAASLYHTIYDLSIQLDKAESRYQTLRTEADYRAAQVRAEGAARATEIQAKERERATRQI